jgi:hypothetical protein
MLNSVVLTHGAVYRTPDDRLFRATAAHRRYGSGPAWSLVPTDVDDAIILPLRDVLSRVLIIEGGRIVYFDLSDPQVVVCNTGWSVDDLILQPDPT